MHSISSLFKQELHEKNAHLHMAIPLLSPAISHDFEGKKVCIIDETVQRERRKFFIIATVISAIVCFSLGLVIINYCTLPLPLMALIKPLSPPLHLCAKGVFAATLSILSAIPWVKLESIDRQKTRQAIDQEAVHQYQTISHPPQPVFEWLATNQTAALALLQEQTVELTKRSQAIHPSTLFTIFWKYDAVKAFSILWDKMTHEQRAQSFLEMTYDESLKEAPLCLMYLIENQKLNPLDFPKEVWHHILLIGAWKKSLVHLINLNFPINARDEQGNTVLGALKLIQKYSILQNETQEELEASIAFLHQEGAKD